LSHHNDFVILGGGISGLTAARSLQERGRSYALLERSPTLGGLTRTIAAGDYCFDYTGHLLHLSHYPTPSDIPFATLDNREWGTISRNSKCLIGSCLITAPIQYNLHELPQHMFDQAVASYNARHTPSTTSSSATLRDYIVSGFGQYLADIFLIPQNEKTLAISLDELTGAAARRFFPHPIEQNVRAGMIAGGAKPDEYNSHFWYPKEGGIQRLVDGLQRGLHHVHLCQDVAAIDLNRRLVLTKDGTTFRWIKLLSSLPLCDFCRLTGDPELIAASRQQTHSSTISFNLGIRGSLPAQLRDIHWVYVPDAAIPFYRVGVYSNISSRLCSTGNYAMYVEVGVPAERVDQVDILDDLQPKVIDSLTRLGWVARRDVVTCVTHVLRCAYVHLTPAREAQMSGLQTRLNECGVQLIGRYGRWDYTSMEDSIRSAIAAVEILTA
jgi:protoporphyrinogen oxidase